MTQPLDGIIVDAEADLGGQLVAVQSRPSLEIFTDPDVVPALLEAIGTAARAFEADVTTEPGRKAIASQAYKVARTKTYLDDLGKKVVADLKELPKQVDAARKSLRDGLDVIRDEVRRDLTAWEERVDVLKRRLTIMQNTPGYVFNADAIAIRTSIETIEATPTDEATWQEFAAEAASIKLVTLATLRQQLEDRLKWEKDQAELVRLRKEEEERKAREAEQERIRAAEQKARREAEDRAAQEVAAAQKREAEAKLAQERAERALEEDRRRAALKEAEARAARPLEPAQALAAATLPLPPVVGMTPEGPIVQAPLHPIPEPIRNTLTATAPGTDDIEHRRACNREALAAILPLVAGDEDMAKAVLGAIVKGQIPRVTLTY